MFLNDTLLMKRTSNVRESNKDVENELSIISNTYAIIGEEKSDSMGLLLILVPHIFL